MTFSSSTTNSTMNPGQLWTNAPNQIRQPRPPLPTDINANIGDEWEDYSATPSNFYKLANLFFNTATWQPFGSASSVLNTLTGNTGGAVSPSAGNINIIGSNAGAITFANTGGSTLTASVLVDGTTIQIIGNQLVAVDTSAGINTIDGDTGSMTGSVVTLSAGSTGLTTNASGTLMNLTGILNLAHGGTSADLTASNGGIFYSTASAGAILAGTATARQMLQSGASTTPAWSTATWPATTTANEILYSSSANVVGQITSANDAVLVTGNSGVPSWLANSSTAGYVLTANSGAPPSWQANESGFSAATWIVSPIAVQGNFTTIAAAISAASAGDDILIRTGTYTENLTYKAGVDLFAWNANALTPLVQIIGNGTFTEAGSISFSGIYFQMNGAAFITVSGSNECHVNFKDCYFAFTSVATGLELISSNAASTVLMKNCNGNAPAVVSNSGSFDVTVGTLTIDDCYFTNQQPGNTGFTSKVDGGSVIIRNSYLETFLQTTGASSAYIENSTLNNSFVNQPCLDVVGSSLVNVNNCILMSGSSSVANVGSTLNITNSTISSTATYAIGSTGNLNYAELSFVSTSTLDPALTLTLLGSDPSNATSGYIWTSTGLNTSPSWQAAPASGPSPLLYAYTSVDNTMSPYTVLTTDSYLSVDCSAGSVVLLFPDNPGDIQYWIVKDRTGSAATYNIVISTVSGGTAIDGVDNYNIVDNFDAVQIVGNKTPTYEVF